MGWQLALEVIGGPMDGLRRLLTGREVTIGRKVGQDITLDRDRKVSNRHVSVCLEGHDWCLRENRQKPSKNGTSLDGKWIEPGESYPLRPGQVIVLASTAIEVLAVSDTENATSPLSYDEWEDPLSLYDMTPELRDLWGRLQSHTRDKGFLDTNDLFRAIVDKERDLAAGQYDCVDNIMSPDCWVALGEWVISKRLAPLYNIDSRDFIVPCRIWQILDMASLDKTKVISSKDVLQGMLREGRSIPARYMAYDKHFLSTMDLYPPEQEIPAPACSIPDMPPPLPRLSRLPPQQIRRSGSNLKRSNTGRKRRSLGRKRRMLGRERRRLGRNR